MTTSMQYLVLGANGALGKLISQNLIAKGHRVIGTARSNESSVTLPANLDQALLLDLEDKESIATFTRYLTQSPVQLDGLINATGRVGFGTTAETSAIDAARLMQINHLGVAEVISRLMPVLANSENSPFMLSITGVVAERPFPGMAAYIASKTAHSAWLKATALEARRAKIRVIEARPPHTETGLAARALFGSAPAFASGLSAEFVALKIVDAIETGIAELPSDSFTI